jgi:hypothetical protein
MNGLLVFHMLLLILAIAAGCIARRVSPDRVWPSMLTKRSFKELRTLGKGEQERIFSEGWNAAFSGWRWFIWECVFWVCFISLPVTSVFTESLRWSLGLIFTVAYVAIFWILRSWEFTYVHPFIKDFAQKH